MELSVWFGVGLLTVFYELVAVVVYAKLPHESPPAEPPPTSAASLAE